MIVTKRELVFIRNGQQVTVPAGTPCGIYRPDRNPADWEAEGLLCRAKVLNRSEGRHRYCVMLLDGQPVLLQQDDIGPAQRLTRPAVAEPAPKPHKASTLF